MILQNITDSKIKCNNVARITSSQGNKWKYCGVYNRIDTGDYVPVLAKTRQNTSVNSKLA